MRSKSVIFKPYPLFFGNAITHRKGDVITKPKLTINYVLNDPVTGQGNSW